MEERDLLSYVSETREALRVCRDARAAFEKNMSDVFLMAHWKVAENDYHESKRRLDSAVNDAIGLFRE